MSLPFRWDISRREQLGRLVAGPEAESYDGFIADLRLCAARVIAASRNADIFFVGRSPESIFDYLSGVLFETSWRDRIALLNVSVRNVSASSLTIGAGRGVHALRDQLASLGLTPQQIATRERPVALTDLVASGTTFRWLAAALLGWTRDDGFDLNALTRRVRFVGITLRRKTSPNTWRWHQDADWLASFGTSAVKNVSIPGVLWDYLGNRQNKVARTHPQSKWLDEAWRYEPPREVANLESLRLALRLFDTGRSSAERDLFTATLAEQPALSKPWLRALVSELRKTPSKGRRKRLSA